MTFHEKDRLVSYMNLIYERAATAIGYPFATDYNYSELYPLLGYALPHNSWGYVTTSVRNNKCYTNNSSL